MSSYSTTRDKQKVKSLSHLLELDGFGITTFMHNPEIEAKLLQHATLIAKKR